MKKLRQMLATFLIMAMLVPLLPSVMANAEDHPPSESYSTDTQEVFLFDTGQDVDFGVDFNSNYNSDFSIDPNNVPTPGFGVTDPAFNPNALDPFSNNDSDFIFNNDNTINPNFDLPTDFTFDSDFVSSDFSLSDQETDTEYTTDFNSDTEIIDTEIIDSETEPATDSGTEITTDETDDYITTDFEAYRDKPQLIVKYTGSSVAVDVETAIVDSVKAARINSLDSMSVGELKTAESSLTGSKSTNVSKTAVAAAIDAATPSELGVAR